jgi:putative ABC transport system permease protein
MLDNTVASARTPLLILLGAVGFMLLIACANVANLNLGRASKRRREIALRMAIGASRARLIRQLLTESMALAVAGAALGWVLANWTVSALLRMASAEIPRAAEVHLDSRVLIFAILAATAAGVLFGLYPAVSASKTDLKEGLTEGARSHSAGPDAQRARGFLVVAEIALALVLMIGAGLLAESFRRIHAVDPGFDPHGLITMRVPVSENRYDSMELRNEFYRKLLERVGAIGGLDAAGAIDGLPFSGRGFDNSFDIEGRHAPLPGEFLHADIRRVDTGYFGAMRIALLQGRNFRESDRADTPPVVIVNQSLARKYWGSESPVGKRMALHFGPPEGIRAEVAGVVADVRSALDSKPNDIIYLHYPQGRSHHELHLVLRPAAGAPPSAALVKEVRAAVATLDPEQPVYRVRTMEELMSQSLATRRYELTLLGIFAGLAALLAAIGLYGVISYSVQARTREIGIRSALGATRPHLVGMVFGQAMKLTAIGLLVGLVGALGLTRVLAKLLYGVAPTDPFTFGMVSGLLLLVAAAASLIPARLAARTDPISALRVD